MLESKIINCITNLQDLMVVTWSRWAASFQIELRRFRSLWWLHICDNQVTQIIILFVSVILQYANLPWGAHTSPRYLEENEQSNVENEYWQGTHDRVLTGIVHTVSAGFLKNGMGLVITSDFVLRPPHIAQSTMPVLRSRIQMLTFCLQMYLLMNPHLPILLSPMTPLWLRDGTLEGSEDHKPNTQVR
jgi:hypothetical protein